MSRLNVVNAVIAKKDKAIAKLKAVKNPSAKQAAALATDIASRAKYVAERDALLAKAAPAAPALPPVPADDGTFTDQAGIYDAWLKSYAAAKGLDPLNITNAQFDTLIQGAPIEVVQAIVATGRLGTPQHPAVSLPSGAWGRFTAVESEQANDGHTYYRLYNHGVLVATETDPPEPFDQTVWAKAKGLIA